MIPEKWRFVPLAEILTRVRNPVLVDNDTSYREIGIRSHGKGIFYKNPKTGEGLGNKSVFWIEPECFVVNIVFAWEQAVAKTTIQEKGMIASHRFPMYKPKSSHLSLEYLLYFFKTAKGKYLLELASPGGAGRNKTLGQTEFLKLEILLPPILEQLKIVEVLGVWDESIDLLERLIGRVRSRKQGLMQQLLTGKKRFKEFEGSEFLVKLLGEIAGTFSGGTPSRTNPEYYNGDIHWIKSGELNLKNIWNTEEKITEEALKNSSAKIVLPDTILIAMYGATAGVIGISRISAAINQAILAIVPNDLCANDYLFYFLQYSIIEVIKKVQGGQPNLNAQIIRSSSIRLPSLPEQEKIAAVLSAADEEISTLEKQLAAYKQQKLGLMQQLLTGRIRI